MDFFKKLILFFSFSFGTFCYEDDNDDDDDYEEVEIIKKKKNKKNKRKNKKSKGRSGIIHTLTDKIHTCADFDIINAPYLSEIDFIKGINNKNNNSFSIFTYLCQTSFLGYNFSRSTGISLKIGFANTLQTQINRYKLKAGVVFRYNLNLLLSLRLLFEGGVGYCFWLEDDNRKFNIENGKSPIFKDLSSFFDTKIDPLIFCANLGIGFLFFSVHIGGEVSLSRLLSTRNSTSVNSNYKEIFDKYLNKKGVAYITDMLNVSLRIYPLMFVDYLIGWLI